MAIIILHIICKVGYHASYIVGYGLSDLTHVVTKFFDCLGM